jgi:hypothetical protein
LKTPRDRKRLSEALGKLAHGMSSYSVEAQATGYSVRHLKRMVAEYRRQLGKEPEGPEADTADATAPAVTPLGNGTPAAPPKPENAALKAFEGAEAGGAAAPGDTRLPVQTVEDVKAAMRERVLDAVQTYRGASIEILVRFRYRGVLRTSDPDVRELCKLGPYATHAVSTNAERLDPYVTKLTAGWGPLIAALAYDFGSAWLALHDKALERGWKPPAKKHRREEEEEEETPAPSFRQAARQAQAELEANMAEAPHSAAQGGQRFVHAPAPQARRRGA